MSKTLTHIITPQVREQAIAAAEAWLARRKRWEDRLRHLEDERLASHGELSSSRRVQQHR